MIYMDLLLSRTSLHVVGQHDVAVVMEVSRFWAFDVLFQGRSCEAEKEPVKVLYDLGTLR